ncbi:sensor histidine kinase [Oceanithermus sp.]
MAATGDRVPGTVSVWLGYLLLAGLLALGVALFFEQESLERAVADARAADSAYQYSQLERDLLLAALECREHSLGEVRLASIRHRTQLAISSQNFAWLSPENQQTLRDLQRDLQSSDPARWSCDLFQGWARLVHPVVIEATDLSNAVRGRLVAQIRGLRHDTALGFLVVILLTLILFISALRNSRRQRLRIASLESEKAFRERLVGMVAHELRTPIATISGFAELLDCRGKNRDNIERIKRTARRLSQTLTHFLDLHRLQSGQALAISKERLDMKRLVEEALETTRAQYPQTRFEPLLPEEPVWLQGDEARLLSAVQNLLSNAAKYGPEGEPVSVRLLATEGKVRLEVEDRGPALSPEEASAVFEPWTRLPRHQRLEGYGLGLPVVREVVKRHGGEIGWEARGSGQVFWLELPAEG